MVSYTFWYFITIPVGLEVARKTSHIKNPGLYFALNSLMWIPVVREVCAAGYFIPYIYQLMGDSMSYNRWGEAVQVMRDKAGELGEELSREET